MGFRITFAKRKGLIGRFSWKDNIITRFALIALFLFGLYISIQYSFRSSMAYILLWVASYLVLFAGTCCRCAYYGKACPIPLEGSLVCHLLPRSEKPFTWPAIFYASIAYVLRIGIPIAVIIKERLVIQGILFGLLFIIFWVAHLFLSGCPNCVNYQCPLNPGGAPPTGVGGTKIFLRLKELKDTDATSRSRRRIHPTIHRGLSAQWVTTNTLWKTNSLNGPVFGVPSKWEYPLNAPIIAGCSGIVTFRLEQSLRSELDLANTNPMR